MTYTGPPLTRPQIDALASVDRRGDTLAVHPAREEALISRGLIRRTNIWGKHSALLTDDGREVLAAAQEDQ